MDDIKRIKETPAFKVGDIVKCMGDICVIDSIPDTEGCLVSYVEKKDGQYKASLYSHPRRLQELRHIPDKNRVKVIKEHLSNYTRAQTLAEWLGTYTEEEIKEARRRGIPDSGICLSTTDDDKE